MLIKNLSIIIFITIALNAVELPQTSEVPGGIVQIIVQSKKIPKAFHNKKPLMVIESNIKNEYIVIAGIGLNQRSGSKYTIEIDKHYSVRKVERVIREKEYKKQYITLKSRKHVELSSANLERHRSEKKRSLAALNSFSSKKFTSLSMIKPVNSNFSDDYGKRRYFNNQPRKPHSGVDMPAKEGTPIKAPLSGKVVIAEEFFFNGNTVYIDHGLGLVTMYAHLSKIGVKVGESVKQGDTIGDVGKTGRATGAHLHWGVSMNGNMIDPTLFF